MLARISGGSRSPLLSLLLFLASFSVAAGLKARPSAQDAAKPPAEQEKTKAATPAHADGDYVGSETCITCHQDQDHRFKNTPMGKAMAHPKTPLASQTAFAPRQSSWNLCRSGWGSYPCRHQLPRAPSPARGKPHNHLMATLEYRF